MKAAGWLIVALVMGALTGCAAGDRGDAAVRMAVLKNTYAHLHERLEKASAKEPLVASAFAEHGQVVLAIRSGLIEDLAGSVARRYLDRVTLDLRGVDAHASGELRRKTFLGRIKVGDWTASVDLGALRGDLRAGSPRVGLRGPDLIDIELPVDVRGTEGEATLRFGWESGALASVVCKSFELTREIRGRVLPQRHRLSGALRLANTGESLTATPVFPDREVDLKLDLTSQSWGVVEAALRSQDTFATCGTLMDPDKGLESLKDLAATGIKVRLPRSIFRTVSLPAHLTKSVQVNRRTVGLAVKAVSLRVESATLWSSASVQVQGSLKP